MRVGRLPAAPVEDVGANIKNLIPKDIPLFQIKVWCWWCVMYLVLESMHKCQVYGRTAEP